MNLHDACETALAIEADGRMLPIEITSEMHYPQYRVRCVSRADDPLIGLTYLELNDRPASVTAAIGQHFAYFASVRASKDPFAGLKDTKEWERP